MILIRALATFNKHCCVAIRSSFGLFNDLFDIGVIKFTGRC